MDVMRMMCRVRTMVVAGVDDRSVVDRSIPIVRPGG
jgi:hypothetical protein